MGADSEPVDEGEEVTLPTVAEKVTTGPEQLAEAIVNTDFKSWYRDYQRVKNIRNGTAYFNGPPAAKPPGEFRASELLKCHRHLYYKHHNAPRESSMPEGQFFVGNQFEHELAEEYLRDAVRRDDRYIQNDLWARVEIETELGTISINGSTDPVVVDESGTPVLPSEIKTTSSIEYRTSPSEHHLAQLHSYMVGLTDRWNRNISHGVLLYADRDSLETVTFDISFDKKFWNDRVVSWLKDNLFYRVFGILPPAEPEQEWECQYCPYKHRCGAADTDYDDENPGGFLPMFTDYPRENVVEYLEAHDDANLTPSLAHSYPDIASEYDVSDWVCSNCHAEVQWDRVDWNGEEAPHCPSCDENGDLGRLCDPSTDEQHYIEIIDRPEEDDE